MFKKILKKTLKIFFIVLAIVVIGGISGVVMERIVFPRLSSFEFFERFSFFQKANERVTVINKTEQITVQENFSLTKTAQNILPTVVSIIEYSDDETTENSEIRASKDIQDHVKTGIILTGDGLVMSVIKQDENLLTQRALAVEKELKYKVFASNGREFEAEKILSDKYANVEFYRIDASNLPAAQLGESGSLETGEKIIAIGNATGEYQNTFSLGVINEKNRRFSMLNSELSSSEVMEGAIMCDAKISEKNMGGPIVDFNGTVVGIAHEIEKDGEDIGFILPIDKLKFSINKALAGEENNRGALGVYYLSINKEIALLNQLPVDRGALIYSFSGQQGLAVKKGSAAELAGLKLGDVVLSVDKRAVNLENPLSQVISEYQAGDKISLVVMRDGETEEMEAVLK